MSKCEIAWIVGVSGVPLLLTFAVVWITAGLEQQHRDRLDAIEQRLEKLEAEWTKPPT